MIALRLVHLIESHSEQLTESLLHKLENSIRAADLQKVPAQEIRDRAREIYRNLSDWLLTKTDSEIEERYVGLGIRRARQGVPFSQFFWAITITKEYLWGHLEREGTLEEPVELLGERELLHTLDRFFDRALYFAALGYESAKVNEPAHKAGAQAAVRR